MDRSLEDELEEISGKGLVLNPDFILPSGGEAQESAPEPEPSVSAQQGEALEVSANLETQVETVSSPLAEPEIELPPFQPAAEETIPQVDDSPKASISEIVLHAAEDSVFFCQHFFPKVFRQSSPDFHREIWGILDDPSKRYVNLQVMRDGAKTTLLRAYTAKRVAYGLSRTILYIGASEKKALASVRWIKRQIEFNKSWAQTFGLQPGKPWTDGELKIEHGTEGHSIWVLGMGISGSVRGINLDDYRPDLIIIDDVVGDDNSATDDQRHKIVDLVLGALKESLSPRSETPDAKMVILNTPRDFEDVSQRALKDTQFASARFGCWTPETEDSPLEEQMSSWPERYPEADWVDERGIKHEGLRSEKNAAIARNSLSIFAREKECKLITPETSYFREEWIKYFGMGEAEVEPPRHEMRVVYVIDPVPPPSAGQIAKGMRGKDFEAHGVIGLWKGKFFALELVSNRGHDPSWTSATFFELCNRWQPSKVIVESVAYQRTLVWLLREAMKRAARYWLVEEFVDKRHKTDRINQGVKGPASNGQLYLRKKQSSLVSQFIHYPGKNPDGMHEDELEVLAIGLTSLQKGFIGEIQDNYFAITDANIPELEYARGAP